MFEEQLEACAPYMREAYKDLEGNAAKPYVRQEDLDLVKTADTEEWSPSEDIRYHVANINDLQVELLDDKTDFDRLLHIFVEDVNIGLVLMGQNISRRKRPALILLTTCDALYVFDPSLEKGIDFLGVCLQDKRLKIWTTNDLHEADCLMKQFNISLFESQARGCLGLHVHLMKIFKYTDLSEYQKLYPDRAILKSRYSPKLETFDDLIYTWLEIDRSDTVHCDPSKLAHLTRRPLSLTAINLIKKRGCLVLKLAERLMVCATLEHKIINNNIIHSFIDITDDYALREFKKYIKGLEKKKTPSRTHFQHLDDIGLEDLVLRL